MSYMTFPIPLASLAVTVKVTNPPAVILVGDIERLVIHGPRELEVGGEGDGEGAGTPPTVTAG